MSEAFPATARNGVSGELAYALEGQAPKQKGVSVIDGIVTSRVLKITLTREQIDALRANPVSRQGVVSVANLDLGVSAIEHYQAIGGELMDVRSDGRRYVLRSVLRLAVRFEQRHWAHDYPELNLFGYGATYEDSLQLFQDAFAQAYENFAETPDNELTGDAQDYKQLLRELVERVE